ncbi:MAG: hypothetical protein U1E89_14690 [Burkholderiaceae bacterium]
MKLVQFILVAVLSAGAPVSAMAQYVKGNEAVRVLADGTKKVETPPLPSVPLGKVCPAAQAGCTGGGWKMLETDSGLMECTEVFARPGTCRPSTYGAEKRSRSWIVKSRGQWMQCQLPDLSGKCVSLTSLPISAVQ